ncbi:GrpB-like predicted nucleotidyltransferase (UPF0157 family) [Kribbella aluminosa]|uniref:GrpB-like predicted nucleotidyltransferase (UPF0157 family) n=1 Tax=Kribbella aluminosa TaxID=416017 RepID=A0ABS4UKL3_9ACTN|nr:GrpB family protein [Kribbella aluminosa]MBP2352192.1 GrpB-like predicted nucleotidyltransferase (UPF0157 family) [Kribbella aluminosa]
MPFPDELGAAVAVVEYDPGWPAEFAALAERIEAALGDRALAVDHTRFALRFRDYLRADPAARDAWGAFKQRLAQSVPNLTDDGQIKAPATTLLMRSAEPWSTQTNWTVA